VTSKKPSRPKHSLERVGEIFRDEQGQYVFSPSSKQGGAPRKRLRDVSLTLHYECLTGFDESKKTEAKAKVAEILAEGVIRPALDAGLRQRQRVTWFSSSPSYEPTARKLWGNGAEPARQLSIDECNTFGSGLYRFAMPLAATKKWRACCAVAGISTAERLELEAMGRQQGGDPANWYGILGSVLLEDVSTVEKWSAERWHLSATA
jgi:hypothetical protein